MITQLDGDMVRTETVLPNGKTLYAEINIRENKTFYCMCSDIVMEVDMELLKAINQQCKKLGWLDETVL